jgi:hypothetical protein
VQVVPAGHHLVTTSPTPVGTAAEAAFPVPPDLPLDENGGGVGAVNGLERPVTGVRQQLR